LRHSGKKECADKYTELKESLLKKDNNDNPNEFILSHEHITDMEKQLEKQMLNKSHNHH